MAEYVEAYVYVCSNCKQIERGFSQKDTICCLICRSLLCTRCERHGFCPEHFQKLTPEDRKTVEQIDERDQVEGQEQLKKKASIMGVADIICFIFLIMSIAWGRLGPMWIGVIFLFFGFCVFFSGKTPYRRTMVQKIPIAQKYRSLNPNTVPSGNE